MHHYIADIVGEPHRVWLEWRPTNLWLFPRTVTVVIE